MARNDFLFASEFAETFDLDIKTVRPLNGPDAVNSASGSQNLQADTSGNKEFNSIESVVSGTPHAQESPGTENADVLIDSHASIYPGFDPEVHAVDEHGAPIPKTYKGQVKPGEYRKKRRGVTQAVAEVTVGRADNTENAKMIGNMAISAAVIVFGEQWAPKERAEADAMTGALRNYLDSRPGATMSPGVALAFVCMAYASTRLVHAETQSRLRRFGGWVQGFFRRKTP